ncbi:divalent cation tolerance protein CutA [Methanobrevibacter arboriphilus]
MFDLVSSVHSYDNPCILALPVLNVAEKYLEWIKDEID